MRAAAFTPFSSEKLSCAPRTPAPRSRRSSFSARLLRRSKVLLVISNGGRVIPLGQFERFLERSGAIRHTEFTSQERLAGGSTLRQFSIKKEPTNAEETSDPGGSRGAGAPAVALAQVEVYGTIHMSLNYGLRHEAPPGAPSVTKFDVASHASNVGVRGRESLGGGLTAWFQVETNASMERSNNIAHTSNFASRNSAVGMQGGWGNLFVGQWTTPWANLDALWGVGTAATYGPITSIIGRRETTGSAPIRTASTAVAVLVALGHRRPLCATPVEAAAASGIRSGAASRTRSTTSRRFLPASR